jgi:Flp pilus assembly secretin CpaC
MGMRLSILRVLRHSARLTIACCLLAAAAGTASAEETLTVRVDQARIVKVPAGTRTLIIGNPMIADVTLLKSGSTMVLTGKGFGETNFIALDANGTPVAKSEIRVVSGSDALVVQRGMERQSYTCAPRCQPIAQLGDDPKYFNEVAAQIAAHNAQATK